jgi:Domain of unknown function (DUF4440)
MADHIEQAGSDRAATEDEIREVERRRLRALVDADVEAAEPLHAGDFQLVSPGGGVYSKQEYLRDVASGLVHYLVWEPTSEIAVRLHGSAADIRYRSHIEIIFDGQRLEGSYWHTDTYEMNDDQWQVVWSQATQIR